MTAATTSLLTRSETRGESQYLSKDMLGSVLQICLFLLLHCPALHYYWTIDILVKEPAQGSQAEIDTIPMLVNVPHLEHI